MGFKETMHGWVEPFQDARDDEIGLEIGEDCQRTSTQSYGVSLTGD